MTIQDARRQLAEDLGSLLDDGGTWSVTTRTNPDVWHRTIVVGHAEAIQPRTFADYFADITVTCYVAEGEEATAVDDLYALVSLDSSSLVVRLRHLGEETNRYVPVKPGGVRPQTKGPSEFLAGEILVRLRLDNS